MECVILGAGGMAPMPIRLTTSVLIRNEGRMIIFDAGEGIQLAIKQGGLGIKKLDAVIISHLHADHILGLPGIMMFRAQCDNPKPLTLIGPQGIKQFVNHTLQDLKYHLNFKLNFIEWTQNSSSLAWKWHEHKLYWHELEHSTFCLGYRLEEQDRPGKFDVNKAVKLQIPHGPLFGKLQNGHSVTLDSGKIITPSDVLGSKRRGRIITYATDTRPCEGLSKLCQNADIAFVEGMFAIVHDKEAAEKMHSTAASSAKIAAKANVNKLVLVHISPRYTLAQESVLQEEAAQYFNNVVIGRGLDIYPVALHD